MPLTLPARGSLVLHTAGLPELAGLAGSISVTSDARYGALTGKAVTLDPGAGMSFEAPLRPRPPSAPAKRDVFMLRSCAVLAVLTVAVASAAGDRWEPLDGNATTANQLVHGAEQLHAVRLNPKSASLP